MFFFNVKMSNTTVKGHNNGVALSTIVEFFKSKTQKKKKKQKKKSLQLEDPSIA